MVENSKVLFLDLDGTILTQNYNISYELLLLCKELSNRMNIFIATGRSVSDAMRYYRKMKLNDYLMCNNGAFIWNPITEDILCCECMKESNIIINYLMENYDLLQIENVIISSGYKTYALNDNNQFMCDMMYDEKLPYIHISMDNMKNIDCIHRIILSVKNLAYCMKNIKDIGTDIDIFSWKGRKDIIDICIKSVNKWMGIEKILDKRKFMAKDIIAFGDARNDIPILQNAGIGVAMANADDYVKRFADYVTQEDNNNNGVYNFIKKNMEMFG